MRVSLHLLKQLKSALAENPLQSGESRRIHGMGSHYISLSPEFEGRKFLFAVKIESQTIYIIRVV
jgi:hypothetical protein